MILIHWNVGFHKNPGMIKLQTRLVDHLKLFEQKIKDTKLYLAQVVYFSQGQQTWGLEQNTHQILTNQSNKIKHSKDP